MDEEGGKSVHACLLQQRQANANPSTQIKVEMSQLASDAAPGVKVEYVHPLHINSQPDVRGHINSPDGEPQSIYMNLDFNWAVFAEQFLIHTTHPFSLPYLLYTRGYRVCVIQSLIPTLSRPFSIFNFLLSSSVWLIAVAGIALVTTSKADSSVHFVELLLPLLYLAMHRGAVACKYALMTPEEYHTIIEGVDVQKSTTLNQCLQLIPGWSNPAPSTIQVEFLSAAHRNLLDPSAYMFKQHSSNRFEFEANEKWRSFLLSSHDIMDQLSDVDLRKAKYFGFLGPQSSSSGSFHSASSNESKQLDEVRQTTTSLAIPFVEEDKQDEIKHPLSHKICNLLVGTMQKLVMYSRWPTFHGEKVTEIPLSLVCLMLFQRVVNQHRKRSGTTEFFGVIGLALIKAWMPCLYRAFRQKVPMFGETPIDRTIIVLCLINTVILFSILVVIINFSKAHFSRRFVMLRAYSTLLSSEVSYETHLPRIDTTVGSNITAWLVGYQLLLSMGTRYAVRIRIYLASALCIAAVLAAMLVVEVIESLSQNGPGLRGNLLMLEVLFDLLLWTTVLLKLASIGLASNHLNFINRVRLARAMSYNYVGSCLYEDLIMGNPPGDLYANKSRAEKQRLKDMSLAEMQETRDRLLDANEAIDRALERLEVLEDTDHETVLGFRADASLINGLGTAFVSVVVFVVQQLFLQNVPGIN